MSKRRPGENESEQYRAGWSACDRGTKRNDEKPADWLRGWDDCHAGRFGDIDPFEFATFTESDNSELS